MSKQTTFTFSYENADSTCGFQHLKIEQEDLGVTGKVTRHHIANLFMRIFFDVSELLPDCGYEEEEGVTVYNTDVYIYSYDETIPFTFGISHGRHTEVVIEEYMHTEVIEVDIDNVLGTEYPVYNLVSAEWVGNTFDVYGTIINPPSLIITGTSLTALYKVYGAIRVVYLTKRYKFTVTVPERVDSLENKYQSVAFCRSICGVEYIELEKPNLSAEDCYSSGGGGVTIDPDDDSDDPLVDPGKDKKKKYDYCTHESLDD